MVLKGMLVWGPLLVYVHRHRHSKQPNAARVWERSQKEKDGRNIKKEVRRGVIITMDRCDYTN